MAISCACIFGADVAGADLSGASLKRAILIRDPNKMVTVAVLSSPKLTETEVESIARMTSVSEEALRIVNIAGRDPNADLDRAGALIPVEQRAAVLALFKQAVKTRLPSVRYDYHVLDVRAAQRGPELRSS